MAGLLAAPLDKLRDAFSKFPADEDVAAAKMQGVPGVGTEAAKRMGARN